MTLVPCPECAHQVSSAALRCPQCGHPIGSWRRLVIVLVVVVSATLAFLLSLRRA